MRAGRQQSTSPQQLTSGRRYRRFFVEVAGLRVRVLTAGARVADRLPEDARVVRALDDDVRLFDERALEPAFDLSARTAVERLEAAERLRADEVLRARALFAARARRAASAARPRAVLPARPARPWRERLTVRSD